MKKIYTDAVKLVMLFALVLCAGMAKAENKISIENFTLDSYDVIDVPVLLDNTDEISGMQLNFVLPDELEVSATPALVQDRKGSNMTIASRAPFELIGVTSLLNKPFKGNSGAVLTIPVKVKEGMLADKKVKINVTGIVMSKTTGGLGTEKVVQDDFEVEVTLQAQTYKYNMYTTPAELVINPGQTVNVDLCLTNDGPVVGMTVDVVLPQGLSVDVDNVATTSRCNEGAMAIASDNGESTRIMLVMIGIENAVKDDTHDGAIITMPIKAAEDYAVENGEMTFAEVRVSHAAGEETLGKGVAMTIVNGATAYTKAKGEITALEEAMTAALATIAEEAPAVKDEFTGAEITAQIEALKAAVDAAYADGTLTGAYDTVMAPAADITAAITALVDAAKAAQAEKEEGDRKAANQAAYDAVVVEIDALQTKLDQTLANVSEQYPGSNVDAQKASAQAAIDKMRDDAAAAFAAVAEEGTFDYKVDATEVDALIAAIEEAAKTSGIDGVFAGEAQGVSEVYTLDGLKVAAPRHGMNIIVTKAGEVKKVLVK